MFHFNSPWSWDVDQLFPEKKKREKKSIFHLSTLSAVVPTRLDGVIRMKPLVPPFWKASRTVSAHTRQDTGDQGQGTRANTSSGLSYQYWLCFRQDTGGKRGALCVCVCVCGRRVCANLFILSTPAEGQSDAVLPITRWAWGCKTHPTPLPPYLLLIDACHFLEDVNQC